MPERNFFESLGNEMIFHKFAKDKLTKEESDALDKFDETYDKETENTELSSKEESDLVNRLLDEIPGARDAFNKFNSIVENLEKQSKHSVKYRNN